MAVLKHLSREMPNYTASRAGDSGTITIGYEELDLPIVW